MIHGLILPLFTLGPFCPVTTQDLGYQRDFYDLIRRNLFDDPNLNQEIKIKI